MRSSIGEKSRFCVRLKSVVLPGVTLLAGASTPKIVDHESSRAALVIPFGGCGSTVRIDGREYRWTGPAEAFFIPAGARALAESTAGSFLRIDVDAARIVSTARTMAATWASAATDPQSTINLRVPRILPLQVAGANWLAQVRSLCSAVDALQCDATVIAAAGLDDLAIRLVVMMLTPESFLPPRCRGRGRPGFDLEALLEWILAHLGNRITLSELERQSGRSARTLQKAFQDRFGIGPFQWLRERRLDVIHARLSLPSETKSVQQIAAEAGIQRLATLAVEYRRRFGEKPCDTRQRSRLGAGIRS